MFKPLGLLASHPCPDSTCRRPHCFFSHATPSSSKVTLDTPVPSASPVRPKPSPAKRKASAEGNARDARQGEQEDGNSEAIVPPKRVRPVGYQDGSIEAVVNKPRAPATQMKVTAPPPPNPPTAAQSVVRSNGAHGPPQLPRTIKISSQPYADRQKGLTTLYTQFTKLYTPLLSAHPDLAHTSALEQESLISTTCPNLKAYKSAIHHAAVQISRRPPPDALSHPSVGTVRDSQEKFRLAEKAEKGRLTRARVERHCLPVEEFAKWGYPDPTPEGRLYEGGGEEPDAEGTNQKCTRCGVGFLVSSEGLEGRVGECKYHPMRTVPERREGRRKWVHQCCGKERGEAGCSDGVHVFSEGERGAEEEGGGMDRRLKRRVGFRNVRQVRNEAGREGDEGGVEVVGMDCEMIYTTAGSSLARVTIVDEKGEILLDELVRQTVPVLDYNTRFSGVTAEVLSTALMDLPAVRAAACMFIGPQTIIVGHGLENDLRALRLVHDRVIDTAVVFPHDKGPPYRRALRDIVKEKLGYFIQDRTTDLGHSSAVDAQATLDALRWKVREDAADAES